MEKNNNKNSALLIVGNEILSGRTKDANAQYIGEKMSERGVPLREVRVVPDIEAKIIEALNALRGEYDYVFTTGGIGPTHDDITAESVAKAFDRPYGLNKEAYAVLEDYYGKEELTDARAKMAMMPEGVSLIPNPVSGAPGFIIDNVHVMAGVPRIMQAMLDHICGLIAHGKPVLSKTITVQKPESVIAQALGEIQKNHREIDIGSYPGYRDGQLWTSIVLRCVDEQALNAAASAVESMVAELE